MTLEEKLEEFKSGTAALRVPTQELWDNLMEELEKQGYKWSSGINPTDRPWDRYWTIVAFSDNAIVYWDDLVDALEITEDDFATPSETVESVMKSIREVKDDLDSYHELFKKYDVVMTENLEPTMRAKLESLLKKRVVS